MRSIVFLSLVLAACGGSVRVAKAPPAPVASATVVASSAPSASSAPTPGSVRPPLAFAKGCVVRSRRPRALALRASPREAPFVEVHADAISIHLGEDGVMGAEGDTMANALRLHGFVARDAVELFAPDVLFGDMLETTRDVRWDRTDAAGRVGLSVALPEDVLLDGIGSATATTECDRLSLDRPHRGRLDPAPQWFHGELASSADGAPRLVGFKGAARIINSHGKSVRVVVESGEFRAYGWTLRKSLGEPYMGIGYGYGTGIGAIRGYRLGADAIACPSPLTIYARMTDRTLADVGVFAAGAPFVRGTAADGWVTLRLGPDGDPLRDAGWLAREADLAACGASSIKSNWKGAPD